MRTVKGWQFGFVDGFEPTLMVYQQPLNSVTE